MQIKLLRAMTRSAVFELCNKSCYYSPAPFTVLLDGKPVVQECKTNVFSLYGLEPGREYTVRVQDTTDCGELMFRTEAESFFVDASRYGLTGDGVTDDTAKLQAAISTCPPHGTVYVPAGTYRTQSLFLRGDITLYLEKGCTLLGGTDRSQYPILPGVLPCCDEVSEHYLGTWEGNPLDCFAGLINVINAENVVITGEGTIDANAQAGDWYQNVRVRRGAWRPRLFFTSNARNVVLHGVKVRNSYSWTVHPTYSQDIDILNIDILNRADSPNTDGIDPEACKNVNIIGNNVHVGDDCIALKSGKVFMGMKLGVPCENILIRNCLLDRGHGGLVIGSEMSGGVRNVHVVQCLMNHTDRGFRLKTRRGRGKIAVIDGLVFQNIEMRGVLTPFVINMFYFCDPDGKTDYVQSHEPLPVDDMTPRLGSFVLEDVTATDAEYAGCWFSGLPEQPIESVEMRNVTIRFAANAGRGQAAMMCNAEPCSKLAIWAENVQHIHLHNVQITGYEGERLQLLHVGELTED
nr:glycoside hydrolase family 28 protein [uncultured Gemmiger sp.]